MRTASSTNCLFWFVAHFLVKIQVTLLDVMLLDVLVWVDWLVFETRCRLQIRQNKSFVAFLLPGKFIARMAWVLLHQHSLLVGEARAGDQLHGCTVWPHDLRKSVRRRGSMVTRELLLILLLSSLLESLHESHDPNSFYLFFLTRFAKHSQRL